MRSSLISLGSEALPSRPNSYAFDVPRRSSPSDQVTPDAARRKSGRYLGKNEFFWKIPIPFWNR
jgi:hypothetical protein